MNNTPAEYFASYNHDACTVCGKCLSRCPVMNLSEQEAISEMETLRKGEDGKHVLSKCETCFACSVACENDANPASLFQQRFFDYYNENGLPAWSEFFQPYESPNYRSVAVSMLGKKDQQTVESWKNMEPVEEFFYPGCNLTSVPGLLDTSLLDGLPIRGGMDVCCGETLFRMGLFDHLRQNAARLDRWLEQLGAKRMYLLCTAGVNMFQNVLPRYGFKSKVEIVPYLPIIEKKLDSGEVEIKNPVDMTVTLQESCYGKIFGPDYYNVPRRLIEKIGGRIVEMEHCKEKSYCCGIGAGFPVKSGYNPVKMILAARRVLNEARRTSANALATYCAGCWMMLNSMRPFAPTTVPVYHVLELLQMAIGETPSRPVLNRMVANLYGPIVHQFPKLASRKKVYKQPIQKSIT